jgi:hypothetical protein
LWCAANKNRWNRRSLSTVFTIASASSSPLHVLATAAEPAQFHAATATTTCPERNRRTEGKINTSRLVSFFETLCYLCLLLFCRRRHPVRCGDIARARCGYRREKPDFIEYATVEPK